MNKKRGKEIDLNNYNADEWALYDDLEVKTTYTKEIRMSGVDRLNYLRYGNSCGLPSSYSVKHLIDEDDYLYLLIEVEE